MGKNLRYYRLGATLLDRREVQLALDKLTYDGEGVGRGVVLQHHVDVLGVALLGCLVKGSVA